jgi:predicted nucleotide-binding protein
MSQKEGIGNDNDFPAELLVTKEEARNLINERIEKGGDLRKKKIFSQEDLQKKKKEFEMWDSFNKDLLERIFSNKRYSREYSEWIPSIMSSDWRTTNEENEELNSEIEDQNNKLTSILERMVLIKEQKNYLKEKKEGKKQKGKIFLGHGHSNDWRDVADFIRDRLHLEYDEFNRESTAGLSNKERLENMLDQAVFSFLIMSAEDEHADQKMHARENVIHEIGLFQGRLGFNKAIILLENGCQEFSNIEGIGQIRYQKNLIKSSFEDIRKVLEREGIIT